MKYLGKRYLHNFLKVNGFAPPALKDMEYGKRGCDEWLRCDSIDVFYTFRKTITVSIFKHDEKDGETYKTERYAYSLTGSVWKKVSERKGLKIKLPKQLAFDLDKAGGVI